MKLLLHMCCGPCASVPIRYFLENQYSVTLYFHNPNIHPLTEYLRRKEAAQKCAGHFDVPVIFDDSAWDITSWLRAVHDCDVKPQRCHYCCISRLENTFEYAKKHGFSCVSTTLLYSIYQPHDIIAHAGEQLAIATKVRFIYQDFRISWQKGIDISREIELYRQPYCGCVYSEAERYQKKLKNFA